MALRIQLESMHLNPKLPPLNQVQKSRIQFWLFELTDMRIEGRITVSPLFSLEFCRICQAYSEDLLAQVFSHTGFSDKVWFNSVLGFDRDLMST